jgi:predicted component of type VI protein secretion system
MAAYALEIVEGPEAGRTIPLRGPAEIGRDPGVDVPLLQDELVSRRHARLTPHDGEVIVEDLDSANGTFVDGDEIHSPAHLLPDGQLLVGVTVLQLKTAEEAELGGTSVRPIPESLASLRPLPSEPEASAVAGTTIRRIPGFAIDEQKPTYVPDDLIASQSHQAQLLALHDSRTKRMAHHAPFALALLVVIVIILFLGLR